MLESVKQTEDATRAEVEDLGETDEAGAKRRGLIDTIRNLSPQRLASRIILLNLLGLVVLVAGILYFNQFRQGLIDARVQSMLTQAHIIAAAVAGSATIDTGSI